MNQIGNFIAKLFHNHSKEKVNVEIYLLGKLVQYYILGILKVMAILAVLNTVALYMMGVRIFLLSPSSSPYAYLLGEEENDN